MDDADDAADDAHADADAKGSDRPPRRWAVTPVGAFVASHVVTLAAVYAARFVHAGWGVLFVLTRWDGSWYLAVAEGGYPNGLPLGTGAAAQTPLGFFPLYPILIRAVASLPGIDDIGAALAVNTAFGLLATVLVWRLAASVFDIDTADRSVVLLCFFVGAYAWTFAYTEGVFMAAGAAVLLLLHHKHFWWAALVGGIGSAARPNGLVFAVTCAVAVVLHWRETRESRALPSPLLASTGFVAHLVYLQAHTGDAFAWQRAQERGWGQRIDFGFSTVKRFVDFAHHPVHDLNLIVPMLTVLSLVPLAWMLWRSRPPATWLVFSAVSIVPSLVTAGVALTPRHVFAAFPLLVCTAWRVRGNAYSGLLAMSAGALGVVTLVSAGTVSLTP